LNISAKRNRNRACVFSETQCSAVCKYVDGSDCCLIGMVLGVSTKKYHLVYPVSVNIMQYQ